MHLSLKVKSEEFIVYIEIQFFKTLPCFDAIVSVGIRFIFKSFPVGRYKM